MKSAHESNYKDRHRKVMASPFALRSDQQASGGHDAAKLKSQNRKSLPIQLVHSSRAERTLPRSTAQNPALNQLSQVTSLLLLQGPIGSFFDRVTSWKKSQGHQVHRIVFNGGDAFYCRNTIPAYYDGNLASWSAYLQRFSKLHGINGVLLFGQTRTYHAIAIQICSRIGIPVFVLEEGYIRPGFLTLEMDGVNSYSNTLAQFKIDTNANPKLSPAPTGKHEFLKSALHAIAYYAALVVRTDRFPHYQHHRHTSLTHYVNFWVRSGITKMANVKRDEKKIQTLLSGTKPYFLVPLQLDTDSQVTHHSLFNDCFEFLEQVMQSFAHHAPGEALLVIKQHPLARGKSGVEKRIALTAQRLCISHNIVFVYSCHLPTLIRDAAGVVTINSTVGLQALFYGRPLKVMGQAIYDRPGVTDPQSLHQFWSQPAPPDRDKAKALFQAIKVLTQVPGTLYESASTPLPWTSTRGQAEGLRCV